ncbi:MAG: hypothetical protein QM774_02135 [Gordonia sp. (in: high G+C Gram-positive bacteria)]|uniref:hypothetical protein n=1 Tax=Gordonia sp. (in: high G+C Gram-positive bacteria) TaxID=84139 RepID=UPI0039E26D82
MSVPGQRQSPFPIVMRGYDRDQVTDHIRRLEADLQMMAADRDSAHAHADELLGHLDDSRSKVRALQQQVDALSVPPTDVAGMSERVSRMLQLATDEAAETRSQAKEEAAETVSVARQQADDIRAQADADAERTLQLAQDQADKLITDAEDRTQAAFEEANATRAQAQQELAEAQKEAAAIIEAAETESTRVRGATHHIASARLDRSRDLAQAAADAHTKVLDHLDALREHLGALPAALALTDDEKSLLGATDEDDLALLNRTLVGREQFEVPAVPQGRRSPMTMENTDVLDALDDEYAQDEVDRFLASAPREDKGDHTPKSA